MGALHASSLAGQTLATVWPAGLAHILASAPLNFTIFRRHCCYFCPLNG